MSLFSFTVTHKSNTTHARVGEIITPHGIIQTPVLAPVGTQATVKTLTPEQIYQTGASLILANTYHLYLRPGADRIANLGGIHKFMNYQLPIMTDSGGFQVFSLGSSIRDGVGKIGNIFPNEGSPTKMKRDSERATTFVKINEDGVTFKSHLNGSKHEFTPEKSLEIQNLIGADFVLTFDECTSPLDSYEYTAIALARTHRWALRSFETYTKLSSGKQALFGIVQGGAYRDLREKSAAFFAEFPCFGYSIGGSLGQSKIDMHNILDWSIPLLRPDAPRHLLGIGQVEDIFECVERGIDIFDCVIPTRWARNGAALVYDVAPNESRKVNTSSIIREGQSKYRINLKNARFADEDIPINPVCDCYTCSQFTRAYLHHLYLSKEILAYTLVSIHNIHFLVNLMKQIRRSICENQYVEFKEEFLGGLL